MKTEQKKSSDSKDIGKDAEKISFSDQVSTKDGWKFLIKPWITEKAHALMALGEYIFHVSKRASKIQIKKAVEDLYKVKVTKVRMINIPAKKRIQGRIVGKKSSYRKAIITLKKGDKIELFEGV